jgi:preprotein translocase subunit SecA
MFNILNNIPILNKKKKTRNEEVVKKILEKEDFFKSFSSLELQEKFQKLKTKTENLVLVDCFAIVREIASRKIGLKHFPSQILGGLVLHQGKIAEMKTGEGKTLVATLPASLNALSGKGVHVVTVNDYLAKRDANWMGNVYKSLGLESGLIQQNMSRKERRKNYSKDITYVTNTELGFDFLRDNSSLRIEDLVLRPFHYCIIDEVDSILIDEARTPLILGGVKDSQIEKYVQADEISKFLISNFDFKIDKKRSSIELTETGTFKIENILKLKDLYDPKDPWIPYILNALKATTIYQKNKDYIVQNKKIMIVDEFTGRIMPDRRWSGGLHQAIEAKEGVFIQGETKTLGLITYQNFFVLYEKISGMTGTGKSAEEEFKKIYNLDVLVLPPAKPLQREDLPDLLYRKQILKLKAVAKECKLNYAIGRPLLIGTASIQNSEILSEILKEMKIPHQVLNARPENVQRESEIIAQAGRKYAITIATNMAGRGTDIILGGNLNTLVKKKISRLFKIIFKEKNFNFLETNSLKKLVEKVFLEMKKNNYSLSYLFNEINRLPEKNVSNFSTVLLKIYQEIYHTLFQNWKKENEEIKKLGGLYVIGTQRHDSRRIDDQLRGRAGRQGDPGKSRFFLSLEDDLLRIFGGEQVAKMLDFFVGNDDENPIESKFLTRILNQSQKKVESFFYESRKNLFEYDEILNKHRAVIYAERKEILKKNDFKKLIFQYTEDFVEEYLSNSKIKNTNSDLKNLGLFLGIHTDLNFLKSLKKIEKFKFFCEQIWIAYDLKERAFETYNSGLMQKFQKKIILTQIDEAWMSHLQKMNLLRDTIAWKGYGQRDPLLVYKDEAFKFFVELICEIRYNVIYSLILSKIV